MTRPKQLLRRTEDLVYVRGTSMPTASMTDESSLVAPLVAIDRVAELLGVNVRHVRRLVYERRIPFIKWGHLLRFDTKELCLWIDLHRHQPDRPLART